MKFKKKTLYRFKFPKSTIYAMIDTDKDIEAERTIDVIFYTHEKYTSKYEEDGVGMINLDQIEYVKEEGVDLDATKSGETKK